MEGSDRLSALRNELQRRLGDQRFDLLIGSHTTFSYENSVLRVGCPTKFQMQWLRRRVNDTLKACCEQVWGRSLAVEYGVDSASDADSGTHDSGRVAIERDDSPATLPMPTISSPIKSDNRDSNGASHKRSISTPRVSSSFENFVVGNGNDLAYRTAKSVTENLGHYGPLLLFGPPGVGKTHLQYAVIRQLRQADPQVRCLRLTAEQFTAEFLNCLDRRALPGFRQKYRSIDVLMIDDIQFLISKKATLEELLHTIDTLHERGRQVVLCCDRSPGDLQSASPELFTRISGGLAIPLQPPDYATRLGLVSQFTKRLKVKVDDEIQAIVATQVTGSARQIQGAINRLVATSRAQAKRLTADMARTTIAEFVQQNSPVVRLSDIQRAVCRVFGVEASSLKSPRKARSVAEPRMLAMWLARRYTRAALGEIGEFFGRRSHSTVISAQKKIDTMVSNGAVLNVADHSCQVEEAIRQVEQAIRTA